MSRVLEMILRLFQFIHFKQDMLWSLIRTTFLRFSTCDCLKHCSFENFSWLMAYLIYPSKFQGTLHFTKGECYFESKL